MTWSITTRERRTSTPRTSASSLRSPLNPSHRPIAMFSPPKIRGTPITPMRLVAINQRNFRNANMVRQSVPRDSFQGDVEDVPRTSLRSDSHVLAHLRRRPSLPHRGVGAPYPLLSLFAYKVFTCHLAQRPGSSFNYAALPRVHTHTASLSNRPILQDCY